MTKGDRNRHSAAFGLLLSVLCNACSVLSALFMHIRIFSLHAQLPALLHIQPKCFVYLLLYGDIGFQFFLRKAVQPVESPLIAGILKALMLAVKRMLPDSGLGRNQRRRLRVYAGPEHKNAAQKPEVSPF